MANCIKMAKVHTILTLRARGWSFRRIGRELGIHRETVTRYIRRAESRPNPAKPAPRVDGLEPANLPTGPDDGESGSPLGEAPALSRPDVASAAGPASTCEPFRAVIKAKLEIGLSAKRIYQDLMAEHGFGGAFITGYLERKVRGQSFNGFLPRIFIR